MRKSFRCHKIQAEKILNERGFTPVFAERGKARKAPGNFSFSKTKRLTTFVKFRESVWCIVVNVSIDLAVLFNKAGED